MSHGIEKRQDMFHVLKGSSRPPWHGVSTDLSDDDKAHFDSMYALEQINGNYNVVKEPIMTVRKVLELANKGFKFDGLAIDDIPTDVKENFALQREDNREVFNTVGSRYEPYQNHEMAKWIQPFLDNKQMYLHTGGLINGGKKVWMLASLAGDPIEVAKGDTVSKHVLISHAHDGSQAITAGLTPVRVECANTLAMALNRGQSSLLKVRHTKGAKVTLEAIQESINKANLTFETTAEKYQFLAKRTIGGEKALMKFVKIIVGAEEKEEDDIKTRTANTMEEIIKMIFTGQGNDNPAIKNTWWQAYNGVNEWLNYSRGRNAENRLNSLWFGPNRTANNDALKLAIEAAEQKGQFA